MARPVLPLAVLETIREIEKRTKRLLKAYDPFSFDVNVVAALKSYVVEAFREEITYYQSLNTAQARGWLEEAASDRIKAANCLLGRNRSASLEEWQKLALELHGTLMDGRAISPIPSATEISRPLVERPATQHSESTGQQLDQLRQECRWTVEELAEKVERDVTTVYRHISGVMNPSLRTIGAYERVFSKKLQKQVVIHKTPEKRQ